jgi:thiol-disulfide isomerase/thioredoxin
VPLPEILAAKALHQKAQDLLLRDHLDNERLPIVFDAADNQFLNTVLEKSPHCEARGLACFNLVERRLSLIRQVNRYRQDNPYWRIDPRQLVLGQARSPFAYLWTTDIAQETKEAETLLERIIRDFADVPIADRRNGKTLGDLAKNHLHEIRELGIGKPAPALASVDLDGKHVKLADLKGKVVVLDIWATWCGPCCAMIPHERELVKRLAGKPFVLVSISVDEDRETLTDFLKKQPMPWTHWFNGPDGQIIVDLNVCSYPTVYVLDDKSVIRFKDVRGETLDRAVDTLLDEVAKPSAPR